MRYAIFSDIHANLEALEAVLSKIDEIAKEKPIDQIWFLGDLVGYGPNPNECILTLRERTEIIIAGNHDWAAVNKIDLEEFSAAARISAEWTAEQLTDEHRDFLTNLPERLNMGECTLVHGSPYGPLWEYLTSEVLAERSFQYFDSRYCFVGHTHLPVIFQQPAVTESDIDSIANIPTAPLRDSELDDMLLASSENTNGDHREDEAEEAIQTRVSHPSQTTASAASQAESAYANPETGQPINEGEANEMLETHVDAMQGTEIEEMSLLGEISLIDEDAETPPQKATTEVDEDDLDEVPTIEPDLHYEAEDAYPDIVSALEQADEMTSEEDILNAEDRLNSEIEELLTLLGLSQSMVQVTNQMLTPPEGPWQTPEGYRAIVNPGGVGQPRDGDPRAAFMIYDTEQGFEFYRVSYEIEKTQEKIIKAGLPQYLAVRLAYGR